MMRDRRHSLFNGLLGCVLVVFISGCFPVSLGRQFQSDPRSTLKVGFHKEGDVIALMGRPFRKSVDDSGRTILVYLWVDGEGDGEKCVIGFNEMGVVHSIEVTP